MALIASNQYTVVVGLGVSGRSVAYFLRQQGVRFFLMDSREKPPGLDQVQKEFSDVSCFTGGLNREVLLAASEIVLSPGIALATPEITAAVAAGIPVIGDIELFARHRKKPLIAITGSNAKTTVTTLVYEMAKASGIAVAVGGNIGRPALELLQEPVDLYVLELSSFQLETTNSLDADVACILNLSEDHMDRYDSLMKYLQAKQRIYYGAKKVVYNRDDVLTRPPMAGDVDYSSFGLGKADRQQTGTTGKEDEVMLTHEFKTLMSEKDLGLRGKHNTANALAALAMGLAAGFDKDAMVAVLKTFSGLPHRCQQVKTVAGVTYINDSKATNVGATLAALKGFGKADNRNLVLIAGGDSKGADLSDLAEALNRFVHTAILLGVDAKKIAEQLDKNTRQIHVASMEEAVNTASLHARQGDMVLLSPACASLDMYKNYEHRGNEFINAVEGLAS